MPRAKSKIPPNTTQPRKPIDVEKIAEAARRREEIKEPQTVYSAMPPAPPAPEPPNPVVLALQEQILQIVTQRTSAQNDITAVNARLRLAEADVNTARERLQQLEGEVQYRLQLIEQMQGRPAEVRISGATPSFVQFPLPGAYSNMENLERGIYEIGRPPQPGMGSIPAPRAPMAGVIGEVRSEDAEDIRRSM